MKNIFILIILISISGCSKTNPHQVINVSPGTIYSVTLASEIEAKNIDDQESRYAIIDKSVEKELSASFYDVKECSRLEKGKYSEIAVVLMPEYGFPCKTHSGKDSSCAGTYSPLTKVVHYSNPESFRHEVLHYFLDVNGQSDKDHESPLFNKCPDRNWKAYELQEKKQLEYAKSAKGNDTTGVLTVSLGLTCNIVGEIVGHIPKGDEWQEEGCRESFEKELAFEKEVIKMDTPAYKGYYAGFYAGREQVLYSKGSYYDPDPWRYVVEQKKARGKARLGKIYQCKDDYPVETCKKTGDVNDIQN